MQQAIQYPDQGNNAEEVLMAYLHHCTVCGVFGACDEGVPFTTLHNAIVQ